MRSSELESTRVDRGGSWDYPHDLLTILHRNQCVSDYRYDDLGFRLLREITVIQQLVEATSYHAR